MPSLFSRAVSEIRKSKSSVVPLNDEEGHRGNWPNKREYILSMVGYAVGLGNVWRFPYLAFQNGGGAFLIPYLIMLVVAGLPIFFLEVSLGQFCSQGPLKAFNGVPMFRGLGVCMVIVSTFVGVYYNVVICYTFFYLFSSLTSELPWQSCHNDWNSNGSCVTKDILQAQIRNSSCSNSPQSNISESNPCLNFSTRISPTEDYWKNYVLNLSSGAHEIGIVRWELCLTLLFTWLVTYLCLVKGIKSSGKAVYVTATFPYVILTALLIRGLTLDGAIDGIYYFVNPVWEKVLNAKVWRDAATQIFYSLSASWGGLITLSSYNKFNNNCYRDSLIVVCTNSFTSIFAGFAVFAVIGFMAKSLDTNIENVVMDGPGLAFVIYPEALSQMTVAPMWSVLFFFMLTTLGLGTMFATLETIVTSLTDTFPEKLLTRKWQFTAVVCVVLFLLGIPLVTEGGFYYLQILDSYAASYTLLLCAILEMLVITYVYGLKRFCNDIEIMLKFQPSIYWKVCWSVISPGILMAILICSFIYYEPLRMDDYKYPFWANCIGWTTVIIGVVPIPIIAVYELVKHKGSLKKACQPIDSWGPYLEEDRNLYLRKVDLSQQEEPSICSITEIHHPQDP